MSAPILSHKLDLAQLTEATLRQQITITASPAQRTALATEFGILSIARLCGQFKFRRDRTGIVHAQLDLDARITQSCIVTLDPVEQSIAERAPLTLLTEAQAHNLENQPIDPDAPDDIAAVGSIIDLGPIVVEQLALAIDPYPRLPDAALPDDLAPQRVSPFAGLAGKK